jgi:hypothetical protein
MLGHCYASRDSIQRTGDAWHAPIGFFGLAVVTLSRNTVMKVDSVNRLKPPKREQAYMFRPWDQQTVLPGARIAIAVMHESADPSWTLADAEFNVILTEQVEAAAAHCAQGVVTAVRGGRRTRLQSGDSGAWKDGLTQQQIDEAIRVEKKSSSVTCSRNRIE